MIPRVMVQVF